MPALKIITIKNPLYTKVDWTVNGLKTSYDDVISAINDFLLVGFKNYKSDDKKRMDR